MSRLCDGGACVVVVLFGDKVFVFTTLRPHWGVVEFTLRKWQDRVTTAQTDGLDVKRFFAGKRGFHRILAPAEIAQFGIDIKTGNYDFVAVPA